MPHFSRWRTLVLIAGLAAACAPALPTTAPTNAAAATSTIAAPATVVASTADPAALRPGDPAPDFSLADNTGALVNLASVVTDHRSTVLIFYLSHT